MSRRAISTPVVLLSMALILVGCPADKEGPDDDARARQDLAVPDVSAADVPADLGLEDGCFADCKPAGPCEDPASTAACDDEDPCTTGDACLEGACVGEPVDCNDDNPCTDDSCHAEDGTCVHANNTEACDDHSTCTEDDTCVDGECVGTGSDVCNDGNPCTLDMCEGDGSCTYEDLTDVPCDDDDLCTTGDTCQAGECISGPLKECNDDNLCTDDGCDSSTGDCVFGPNTIECSDGDACTAVDTCADGACVPGSELNCDDGDDCTVDTCDPVSGCVNTNVPLDCDGDWSEWSSCVPAEEGACLGTRTRTFTVSVPSACGGDECPAAEQEPCPMPVDTACSDGNPCTESDLCDGVAACAGTPVDCDDGIACTVDSCGADGVCLHVADDSGCDDGNPCTTNVCEPGAGCVTSNSSVVFLEDFSSPDEGWTMDGEWEIAPAEAVDCDYSFMGSEPALDHSPSDDNMLAGVVVGGCYADEQHAATCLTSPVIDLSGVEGATVYYWRHIASDHLPFVNSTVEAWNGEEWVQLWQYTKKGDFLIDDDWTLLSHDLSGVLNPALQVRWCFAVESVGAFSAPGWSVDDVAIEVLQSCDSADLCNIASQCHFGACEVVEVLTCDDDISCTVDSCDPATGECVFAPDDAACDDENECSDDICDPQAGCTSIPNDLACDDGNLCTTNDVCAEGSCAGTPVVCNDDVDCTVDTCSLDTGECTFTPDDSFCSDNLGCTGEEFCDANDGCQAGTPPVCDDSNPCTQDACVETCGGGNAYNGHCYISYDAEAITWAAAEQACVELGGHLASIADEAEYNAAYTAGNVPAWLGGSDMDQEGTWTWTDGSEWTGFAPWHPMFDDENEDADFLATTATKEWYNWQPSKKLSHYVCEFVGSQAGCAADPLGNTYFFEDFSEPDEGWTMDGQWEIGPAEASSCADGKGDDPDTDHSTGNDDMVAGVLIGACYAKDITDKMCLTSPVIDLSADTSATLSFWRVLGSDYPPYVVPTVEVFDGEEWVVIYSTKTGNMIKDTEWTHVSYSLDDVLNDAFQVRWCHQVAGDFSIPFGGWNIDDVEIGAGLDCTINDQCATATACIAGECTAVQEVDCDDGVECTLDVCDPETAECSHTPDDNACDDGINCTLEFCDADMGCVFEPANYLCDDNNECTIDSCLLGVGCEHADEAPGPCDDGDMCTYKDWCWKGKCTGISVKCDDLVECTLDACDPETGECIHTEDDGLCDDGVACTMDACFADLGCEHDIDDFSCDDDNPCTHDVCDPDAGCQNIADDSLICDDGDACTTGDECVEGECVTTGTLECDDGAACNGIETCDSATGCVEGEAISCDDGNDCTFDTCMDVCPGTTYNGHCYVATVADLLWQDAEAECVAQGGHLASIADAEEDAHVFATLMATCPGDAWVGGNDIAEEGTWVWTDGSEWTGYTHWYKNNGPPAGVWNADVLKVHHGLGTWFNLRTDLPAPCYICEFEGTLGSCSYQNEAPGTSCDDGNDCTILDACVQGACSGLDVCG